MLNYLTANGGTTQDINGPTANTGAQGLISMINDTRTWLQGLNLPKSLPIGNSDAGSFFNNEVLASVDYGVRVMILANQPIQLMHVSCALWLRWQMYTRGLLT